MSRGPLIPIKHGGREKGAGQFSLLAQDVKEEVVELNCGIPYLLEAAAEVGLALWVRRGTFILLEDAPGMCCSSPVQKP